MVLFFAYIYLLVYTVFFVIAVNIYTKVLLTLRHSKIHTKETQVSKPKAAVIHAKFFVYA